MGVCWLALWRWPHSNSNKHSILFWIIVSAPFVTFVFRNSGVKKAQLSFLCNSIVSHHSPGVKKAQSSFLRDPIVSCFHPGQTKLSAAIGSEMQQMESIKIMMTSWRETMLTCLHQQQHKQASTWIDLNILAVAPTTTWPTCKQIPKIDLHPVHLHVQTRLLDLAIRSWWPSWNDASACCLLGTEVVGDIVHTWPTATHFVVSTNTNLSEEVHHSYFNDWIVKESSIQGELKQLSSDEEQFKFVVEEFTAIGLQGCAGLVGDCVHLGCGKCPTQHLIMYKGKDCFPTLAYQVVCISQTFIQQSVSFGHAGSRNDNKHIACTARAINDLLYGSGWLHSQS